MSAWLLAENHLLLPLTSTLSKRLQLLGFTQHFLKLKTRPIKFTIQTSICRIYVTFR